MVPVARGRAGDWLPGYRPPASDTRARALGWPVRTLHLDHLALLARPALVAAPLADLVTDLTG